jgi:ABC-2 type transport system ATP-binding protein
MLRFENITKIFKTDILTAPVVALDSVNLHIKSQSMVGFLGANGAGKTTSMKIMLDFIRPDQGSVHYGNELGGSLKNALSKIGFLPERPYFYPHLKGHEFVSFMGELQGLSKTTIKERSRGWAEKLRIDHALDRYLRTYSKGMLQRLGFLTVVIHEPSLIILDEPLSGLDPVGRQELKAIMRELHAAGQTVFFSSHVVPDVEEICSEVVFLSNGKLAYQGSVDALMRENVGQTFWIKTPVTDRPLHTPLLKKERLSDELVRFEVSRQEQENLLRELLQAGIPILGLEQSRKSLEEVFYQIKGKVAP